ncbi:putative orphan protein [Pseudoalteromonas luteoviolacea B = ATCC 29581]|nr:putative orphan protein [Pseudoalteromonas luteoviolacea B = ATCC 29581]
MQFPNDENGQLLAEMHTAGIDLDKLLPVDFFILFEQENNAKAFIAALTKDELAPIMSLQTCPDTGVWEVKTTVTMVPEHQLLSQTEQYLESIADKHDGYGDGWGILAE